MIEALVPPKSPHRVYAQTTNPVDLIQSEAETIYLSNLERQSRGLSPLRWNRELSESARWFAWDTVQRRSTSYCGHKDTRSRSVGARAAEHNYPRRGLLGENAVCGYTTPAEAVASWMKSEGHRANMLNPEYREVGLGYYRNRSNGRGYIVQDLGHDRMFAPIIIENEKLTTDDSTVDLYIYDRVPNNAFFGGLGLATEMMIANDPTFAGASWEPYAAHKSWMLAPGDGWRTVYVMTRDADGRTLTAYDTIYVGTDIPPRELTLYHASSVHAQLTFRDLLNVTSAGAEGWTSAQFSMGWLATDANANLSLVSGKGQGISDADANGGTAYQLSAGEGTSYAWLWSHDFYIDVPMVAYLRVKVSDNSSDHEVFKVLLNAGGSEQVLRLTGRDFAAANTYQEFAIPFTAQENPDNEFLTFHFYRLGNVDVALDEIAFFTAPQPIAPEIIWDVPGNDYRGAGISVRFTNESGNFSPSYDIPYHSLNLPAPTDPMSVAAQEPEAIIVEPNVPLAESTFTRSVECPICQADSQWTITSDQPWLAGERDGPKRLLGRINITGLGPGVYDAVLKIKVVREGEEQSIEYPVTLTIEETPAATAPLAFQVMLPLMLRGK